MVNCLYLRLNIYIYYVNINVFELKIIFMYSQDLHVCR